MDRRRELILLQEEWKKRRSEDPLRSFEPHAKQRQFIDAVFNGEYDHVWYMGANRSGKSQIGAYCGAQLARFGHPNPKAAYSSGMEVRDRATSGWVVSLDFPNSRDVVAPKYFDNGFVSPGGATPMIPQHEVKEWRATDQILKLRNGSIIGFKSCDAPAIKLAGAGKDWIHFDEEPPAAHYEEATIRLEAGRKLLVFGTATLLPPVGVAGGISWLFPKVIRPWQKGQLERTQIITASIHDNPHIDPAEIKMLETLFPPGTPQHDIRILGELVPGIGGARAYQAFSQKLHVSKLGPIDMHRPVAWVWDFNVEPMITLIGQRHEHRFRVHKELILEPGSIPDMCEYAYNVLSGHASEIHIYGDATGMNRTAQYGDTDYRIISNQLRRFGVPFRIRVRPKNPLVSDRINAVNRALKDEFDVKHLEIDESCEELIQDMEGVLLEAGGGIKKSRNKNDPYYRRTHASDALGYWVEYEAPVRFKSLGVRLRAGGVRDAKYGFSMQDMR